MLFRPSSAVTLLQGKMTSELGSSSGRPMLVALDGSTFGPADVAFVIPDDEGQGATIQAAGYRVHTPMSMCLGDGCTEL